MSPSPSSLASILEFLDQSDVVVTYTLEGEITSKKNQTNKKVEPYWL